MSLVSIIVPIYNNEQFLDECIKSLLSQTYKNIEIILINDGSTDRSLEICESYAQRDNRIIVHSIPNSGVSVARNIGLELSSGDYVMFVDSDDWIDMNTVELALRKIQETNSDIVIWSYYKNFYDKELRMSLVPGRDRTFKDDNDKAILYLKSIYSKYGEKENMDAVSVGTVMCKLYNKKLIVENNIKFNPKLIRAEDVVFALQAFKCANKITYFDKNLYHYRMNESSMCSATRYIEDTITPFNYLLEELYSFQKSICEVKDTKKALNGRTIQVLLWHLKYHYYNKDNKKGLLQRRKEIIELIKEEPFKSALFDIDLPSIPKQEKLMVILFRKNLILLHFILQKIIDKRNQAKIKYY